MAEEYRFHYERFGFSFTVYEKRIDVRARRFLGNWTVESLLLRNVTDVAVVGPGKLRLTLSDGKAREYILGTKAEGARVTILTLI